MESLPPLMTGIVVVLLFSCFVKIATTLSILKFGMGLQGFGLSAVVFALSLALTLLVMEPTFAKFGGVEGVIAGKIPSDPAFQERIKPFLEKNSDHQVLMSFSSLRSKLHADKAVPAQDAEPEQQQQSRPISVLASAFLVSELMDAFRIGLVILLPFLLIDLLVANIAAAMGMQELNQAAVAVPLKLLLFIAVDGWLMISEKLIRGYVF